MPHLTLEYTRNLTAFDPARSLLGWIEVLLSVSLFCAALMYTRWRFQYDRILAGEL